MRSILVFVLLFTAPTFAQGQIQFPVYVVPGDTFIVQRQYGDLNVDRLWVLTNNQYQKAVKASKKDMLDKEIESILERKIKIYGQIVAQKDSIIRYNREGYLHYRDLWQETDRKLEKEEIKSAKNFKWGFYLGAAVSAATFTALKLLLD